MTEQETLTKTYCKKKSNTSFVQFFYPTPGMIQHAAAHACMPSGVTFTHRLFGTIIMLCRDLASAALIRRCQALMLEVSTR